MKLCINDKCYVMKIPLLCNMLGSSPCHTSRLTVVDPLPLLRIFYTS